MLRASERECQVKTSTVVLESQADWLTAAVHTADKNVTLEHYASGWAARELADGAKMRPWRLMGYEGYLAGRVRYGTRQAAGLVQLSGDLAARHLDGLVPLADNVSRLDLAVTAQFTPPQPDTGSVAYLDAEHHYKEHSTAARPWRIADADGGWTTYLGDRSSDTFLRLYNKQAECRASSDAAGELHYAGCWRWELELKGHFAKSAAHSLQAAPDRPAFVQGWMYDYVTKHGMRPPWERSGGAKLAGAFRRRSDRESRLSWLRRSVAPSVAWLLENGDRTDVLTALGLSDYAVGDTPG